MTEQKEERKYLLYLIEMRKERKYWRKEQLILRSFILPVIDIDTAFNFYIGSLFYLKVRWRFLNWVLLQ